MVETQVPFHLKANCFAIKACIFLYGVVLYELFHSLTSHIYNAEALVYTESHKAKVSLAIFL